MVNEWGDYLMEESLIRQKRMSRDRYHSGKRIDSDGFRCISCGLYVIRNPVFSGVVNRNHCPYCLWSRHVDWKAAGDRMSACKGKMKPVGLTQKRCTKKYQTGHGELMLIHACESCGHLSINRISADDLANEIYAVFENSWTLDPTAYSNSGNAALEWLSRDQKQLVLACLFGVN
jgi:hypothetical protein